MSIREERFDDAKDAMGFLESYIHDYEGFQFRGHQDSIYRLQSTWFRRYSRLSHDMPFFLKQNLDLFKTCIMKMGAAPQGCSTNMDWLEFARHHGLPSPLIDFTASPYIALFFAFSEVPNANPAQTKPDYVSVNCLNVFALAWGVLLNQYEEQQGQFERMEEEFSGFLNPSNDIFEGGFTKGIHFIKSPGVHNLRMQKQIGAFVYDGREYSEEIPDFEAFLDSINEDNLPDSQPEPLRGPALTKVEIHSKCRTEVLTRLELMGINGLALFGDEFGAAIDVYNTDHYHPKSMYVRNR